MAEQAIQYFFDQWSSAKGYWKESAVENPKFENYKEAIENIIGKEEYRKVSDKIVSFACEAEETAFSYGFKYGVMFMSSILNGGMMNERITDF